MRPLIPEDLFRIAAAQADALPKEELGYPAVPRVRPAGSQATLAPSAGETLKQDWGLTSQDVFYFGTGRQLAGSVDRMLASAVGTTFWIEDTAAWKASRPELYRSLCEFYSRYPWCPASFHAAPLWWSDRCFAKVLLGTDVSDALKPAFDVERPLGTGDRLGFEDHPDPGTRSDTAIWLNTQALQWARPEGLSVGEERIAHVWQWRKATARGGVTRRQVLSVAGAGSEFTSLLLRGAHPVLEGKAHPMYLDAAGNLRLTRSGRNRMEQIAGESIFDFHHLTAQRLYMDVGGRVLSDRLEFSVQPRSGLFGPVATQHSLFVVTEQEDLEFTPFGRWAVPQH